MATFFFDIIFGGTLSEMIACQQQHATHKVCGRDASGALDFPVGKK